MLHHARKLQRKRPSELAYRNSGFVLQPQQHMTSSGIGERGERAVYT